MPVTSKATVGTLKRVGEGFVTNRKSKNSGANKAKVSMPAFSKAASRAVDDVQPAPTLHKRDSYPMVSTTDKMRHPGGGGSR